MVLVTDFFNILCRFIMHMTSQYSFEEWEDILPKCRRREIEDKEESKTIYNKK
jgi:hypothetical protein